jgi:hypothetical protein
MLIINPRPTVNAIVVDHRPARALGRRTDMISQHHRRGFRHTSGSLDLTPISGPCFGPQDSKKRAKVISPSIGAGPRGVDSTETQYQDTVFHGNIRRSSTETVSTPDHSSCFRASRSGSDVNNASNPLCAAELLRVSTEERKAVCEAWKESEKSGNAARGGGT